MQNQEIFGLFTKMAKEAGFDKTFDNWYFEGSIDPDGWSSNSRVIDGVPVKFFMWTDEITKDSFKPSLIVDVDEVIEMHSDKIGWGRNAEICAADFCADISDEVNYTFNKTIADLSAADIIKMISNVVRNAKHIYNEYELV